MSHAIRVSRSIALLACLLILTADRFSFAYTSNATRVVSNESRSLVSNPQTTSVSGGSDLQEVLDHASAGDVIELEAGATFTGNFTLSSKQPPGSADDEWITIRSSAVQSGLPPEGTRMSPSFANALPKLVTPTGAPVLTTSPGSHHYRFVGIEFTLTPGTKVNSLIKLAEGTETDVSRLPHDIIFERCYIHGDQISTLRRGIALNSASTTVIDSYISECHEAGADSQAICGWNGPGPFKIVNNYLEAAAENIMFGGADPKIKGLIPSDIEIRQNHLSKPLRWKASDASYDGSHWTIKNLLELKNAQRVTIEGNLIENVWPSGQAGYAVSFKSVNQEGKAPWSSTSDVQFRNNIVRHCAGGVIVEGRSLTQPGGRTSRVRVMNNLFDDVGGPTWRGDGAFLKITDSQDVTMDHNTVIQTGNIITAYGQPSNGFKFTNNLVQNKQFGVKGDGTASGMETLDKYFSVPVFKKNLIVGDDSEEYPAKNFFVQTLDQVGLVNPDNSDYHLMPSSAFRHAGTKGRDIGADIDAIQSALADADKVN